MTKSYSEHFNNCIQHYVTNSVDNKVVPSWRGWLKKIESKKLDTYSVRQYAGDRRSQYYGFDRRLRGINHHRWAGDQHWWKYRDNFYVFYPINYEKNISHFINCKQYLNLLINYKKYRAVNMSHHYKQWRTPTYRTRESTTPTYYQEWTILEVLTYPESIWNNSTFIIWLIITTVWCALHR